MKNELILVAGEGRNVGKTTLICALVKTLAGKQPITAVKISKHKHATTNKQKLLYSESNLLIYEETDAFSGKDTARYLEAGAEKSLFVLCGNEALENFVKWLKQNISGTIICESSGLGENVVPKLAIVVKSEQAVKTIKWNFSFQTTQLKNNQFEPAVSVLLEGYN